MSDTTAFETVLQPLEATVSEPTQQHQARALFSPAFAAWLTDTGAAAIEQRLERTLTGEPLTPADVRAVRNVLEGLQICAGFDPLNIHSIDAEIIGLAVAGISELGGMLPGWGSNYC